VRGGSGFFACRDRPGRLFCRSGASAHAGASQFCWRDIHNHAEVHHGEIDRCAKGREEEAGENDEGEEAGQAAEKEPGIEN